MFARNRVQSSWNLWSTHLPDVKAHYAVKSNPDPLLLKTLSLYGSGFDCASGRELQEVAALGFSKEEMKKEVVYANPCKPIRDLKIATELGTPTTVIDSFEEIDKVSSVEYTGSSLIRILVEDKGSLMPFSRKFGIFPSKVKDLSKYAKSKNLPILGISFHVGSGCKDKKQYSSAIGLAHQCMSIIKSEGHTPSLVDIGGGFLSESSQRGSFVDYAKEIRSAMDKEKKFTYIAEPGRFFSSSSFDLFVQVIGKKPLNDGNGWRYTIDDSLYGQFSCIPFDQKIPLWIRIPHTGSDTKPRKASKGVLFGRTCDSLDMIAKSYSMEELDVGDWLWFPEMGAYTSVTASEFNGFPKPPVLDVAEALPFLYDLAPNNLKDRLPFDVMTVNGVSLGLPTIPGVA